MWQHQPAASVPRADDLGARQLMLPRYGHMVPDAVEKVCDVLATAIRADH